MDMTMKILLAVDGSEYSKRAAAYVRQHSGLLAEPPEIHVLHVHPPLPYPGAMKIIGKAAVDEYQREESLASLAVAEKALEGSRSTPKVSWSVGDVTEEVRRYAERNAIDLIVVGSHGRSAASSFALGSVTLKLLATLKTPILVVR
jgi:nucleotide-binding universal stress UspA family protein